MRSLRIGTRLIIGFGATLALFTGLVAWIILAQESASHTFLDTVARTGEKEVLALNLRISGLQRSIALRNVALRSGRQDITKAAREAGLIAEQFAARLAEFGRLNLREREREIITRVQETHQQLSGVQRNALAAAVDRGDLAEIIAFLHDDIDTIDDDLSWLLELQRKEHSIQARELEGQIDAVRITAAVAAGLATAIAIALAIVLTRSVVVPLREAVQVAQLVASGNLVTPVKVAGRDEATQLHDALEQMRRALFGIVGDIRRGAAIIAMGASRVVSGNRTLSRRTEEHASSLEETASTLEEFTRAVRSNTDRATMAREIAARTSERARSLGEVVEQLVRTMSSVTESSRTIGEIVGVIDSIAFQTNILALNAAVEAARAGEDGRGFAVVAQEVRSLAQRCAVSSKEIRDLIRRSIATVEEGARNVDVVGQASRAMIGDARDVSTIMVELARASAEQSAGIEQINNAVTAMDAAVHSNAAMVEEAAAAAAGMSHQAEQLKHSVDRFAVGHEPPGASARAGGAPADPRGAEARLDAPPCMNA